MKKVELIIKPDSGRPNTNLPLPVHLAKAPPFYLAGKGRYIHRVKSAVLRENRGSFISVTLWCGAIGFISDRRHGRFLDDPSACELPCCATCEGRAIGAGWDGAREIAGRPVMFSPLLKRPELTRE